MKIKNCSLNINEVGENDIFICTIGFENRSRHLLDRVVGKIKKENIFVLFFNDLCKDCDIANYLGKIKSKNIQTRGINYDQNKEVTAAILEFLSKRTVEGEVYIDYSAMPRKWYSFLPIILLKQLNISAHFIYVLGEYTEKYLEYPCAGVETYSRVGKTSLQPAKRIHILGVGYDKIRTKGLLSILDPESYAICTAHYSEDEEMEKRLTDVNKEVIERAAFMIELNLDDFEKMFATLSEIAYDYMRHGDVLFVTDGPKPLIMAMSLVPQIINRPGVATILVGRNAQCFSSPIVEAKEKYFGFYLYDEL